MAAVTLDYHICGTGIGHGFDFSGTGFRFFKKKDGFCFFAERYYHLVSGGFMSGDALQPIEQKTVFFYDDEITAVVIEDEEQAVYIPLRPLCEHLGLNWSGQQQRVNRDPVLREVTMSVCVTHTDLDPSSRQPRTSNFLAIPLDYLNGWLFGAYRSKTPSEPIYSRG